jgi:hypothetical protein
MRKVCSGMNNPSKTDSDNVQTGPASSFNNSEDELDSVSHLMSKKFVAIRAKSDIITDSHSPRNDSIVSSNSARTDWQAFRAMCGHNTSNLSVALQNLEPFAPSISGYASMHLAFGPCPGSSRSAASSAATRMNRGSGDRESSLFLKRDSEIWGLRPPPTPTSRGATASPSCTQGQPRDHSAGILAGRGRAERHRQPQESTLPFRPSAPRGSVQAGSSSVRRNDSANGSVERSQGERHRPTQNSRPWAGAGPRSSRAAVVDGRRKTRGRSREQR